MIAPLVRILTLVFTLFAAGSASAASETSRISFLGTNAYDFHEMGQADAQPVDGVLALPDGTGTVRGAAILSHGSGGPGNRQTRMSDALVAAGYAVLTLDHFGPRGIGSTVRDQLRVTAQMMLTDVFAARALLAVHPRIPPGRIGVIGWSKGGIVASLAAVDRLAGYAAGGPERLAFAVAFYPYCGFDLDAEQVATPLLYMLGGEDDWTPAPPCQRQAQAWAAAGAPVEVVFYPDAKHGFDSTSPDFQISQAVTVRDTSPRCTLTVDPSGRSVTLDGGLGVETLARRTEFVAKCGERGVGFGGNPAARADAVSQVRAFIARALGP